MNTENQETIADIITEARGVFDELRKHGYNVVSVDRMADIIDRVEEAHKREAEAALSAPPRNCDVGTPEEQIKRHREWCRQARCVFGCIQCMADWLQLPYVRELHTTGEVVK